MNKENIVSIVKHYKIFIILVCLYVLVQLIYVIFFPLPFYSDSKNYLNFALNAIKENTYYPNPSSIYDWWIVAPVYINYLIILLKIFGTPTVILFFNILLNISQLILVMAITKKIFDFRTSIVAGIVYMLYLNNTGLVLLNLTELMFGVLVLLSIYFYFSKENILFYTLCGFFAGLALGVRPTAYGLFIGFVILYLISIFQKKANHKKFIFITLGCTLYIVPMGLASKNNIGYFIYSSTTGASNLIMSASEKANGEFNDKIFKNDPVVKRIRVFSVRDKYLIKRSINYIKENPVHYLSIIPRKIYSTFISDEWAISELLHTQKWDLNKYLKSIKNSKDTFKKEPLLFKLSFFILNFFQQFIYMLLLIGYFYQVYFVIKNKIFTNNMILLLNLFIFCGMAMSLLVSIGNIRYKYNFLIASIILVSPFLKNIAKHFSSLVMEKTNKNMFTRQSEQTV